MMYGVEFFIEFSELNEHIYINIILVRITLNNN